MIENDFCMRIFCVNGIPEFLHKIVHSLILPRTIQIPVRIIFFRRERQGATGCFLKCGFASGATAIAECVHRIQKHSVDLIIVKHFHDDREGILAEIIAENTDPCVMIFRNKCIPGCFFLKPIRMFSAHFAIQPQIEISNCPHPFFVKCRCEISGQIDLCVGMLYSITCRMKAKTGMIFAENDSILDPCFFCRFYNTSDVRIIPTLTAAKSRMLRGETQYNPVSRFLREIPHHLMDNHPPAGRKKEVTYEADSREAEVFKSKPFGMANKTSEASFLVKGMGDTGKSARVDLRPKAQLKPKVTALENKPFIAKGQTLSGLAKGAPSLGKLEYGVGDRVKHIKFGEGLVKDIVPGPRDYQVTIEFDLVGQKIMYAAFAKLKKI